MAIYFVGIERGQVDALARLHSQAFPGFFLAALGPQFLTQFYKGFVADKTAVTSIALAGSDVVGAAVGTSSPDGYFGRLLRRQFMGFAAASVRAVVAQPSVFPRLLRAVRYRGAVPGAPRGALLSSLCVHPGYRSEGLGSELLADWEARAVQNGADHAYLTTDALDNHGANLFYVRNGWNLAGSFATPEERVLNIYTRRLRLAPGAR